jgi:hypothetical protein
MLLRLIGKLLAETFVNREAGDLLIQSTITDVVLELFGLRLLRISPARFGLPRRGYALAYRQAISI